jgi:hypothetical protein
MHVCMYDHVKVGPFLFAVQTDGLHFSTTHQGNVLISNYSLSFFRLPGGKGYDLHVKWVS